MLDLDDIKLEAGELISGMSVGVAHFDAEDHLCTTNDQFGALLPLLGPSFDRRVSFRDLMQSALHCGQFDLGSMPRSAWLDSVYNTFDRALGRPIEIKRSDRRWLLMSCRMTALGHRIVNLVDISSQKHLSEFISEFSEIVGSRQIQAELRLERVLLLGCAYLNLPCGAILRHSDEEIATVAEAAPSRDHGLEMASLYNRLDPQGVVTTAPLDPSQPDEGFAELLIGKSFRLDEGELAAIVFAGAHWGDGPLNDSDGQILQIMSDWIAQELARRQDQLELERAYDELKLAATTDFLTGCYNRRHFMEMALATMNFHRRIQRPFAFLLLDIDHFKDVNDRYGHGAGDAALRQFADIANAALRDHDIIARYGGEEFAIFLYNTDSEGARLVAERIRRSVAATEIRFQDETYAITVSIGVCPVTLDHNQTVDDCLRLADQALYSAKKAGRNQVSFADC